VGECEGVRGWKWGRGEREGPGGGVSEEDREGEG
jgi:hypothetical protein